MKLNKYFALLTILCTNIRKVEHDSQILFNINMSQKLQLQIKNQNMKVQIFLNQILVKQIHK